MGYLSTITPGFSIKKELVPTFRAKLQELFTEARESTAPSQKSQVISNLLEDNLEVDNEGQIYFNNYYQKWYEDEVLARFLAPYAIGTLEFVGEDDARWGYEFHKGKLYELDYYTRRGHRLS